MKSKFYLEKGDLIGIVAPSDSVNLNLKTQFEKGLKFITDLGLRLKLGKYILCDSEGKQRSSIEKAEDINRMFANISIKAIICAQGGNNSNEVLSFLDYEIIKNNPKPFIGISDATYLLNGIYKKTGIITYHGNDIIWGFGRSPTDYDTKEFKDKIVCGNFSKFNHNSIWQVLKSGVAEGKLVGGNFYCFSKLFETEFAPDVENKILFIEEYKPTKEQFIQTIELLKKLKVFDKIKGIILGHVFGLNEESAIILSDLLRDYNFPIIKCDDFGHNTPNTVIPIGMKVKIDTNRKEITYLKC